MKRFLLLLSFLFAVIAWADNKPLTETYVESTKVLSSNYFGAEIELSINLEQIEEPVFVCPKISSIERGCIPQLLVHGNNVIRFLVSREFELDAEFITDSVTVDIYTSGNPDQRTLLKTEAPIEILWPGPKVTELEYADSINHSVNYSSLERIYVPYRDPNFSSIIANLVGSGLPLSRIRSSVHPSPESLKRITVGKDVSGVVLASVINAISPMIEGSLELVVFENEKYNKYNTVSKQNWVYIGNTSSFLQGGKERVKVSPEVMFTLRSEKLSDEEVIKNLGLKTESPDEILQRKIKVAYELIDLGGNKNFKKAKTLIEEVLTINPELPQAYLELARIAMKTNWDEGGLLKAEELILTSKDINPEYANSSVLLGYVYTNQERFEEAEKEYKLAESLGSTNLWLYANWGLNEERKNNPKTALEYYRKVLNTSVTEKRNHKARSWVCSGQVILATVLEEIQKSSSARFGDNPPLC